MNLLLPHTPEIDFCEALDQMGGDVELLHEVIDIFLETAADLFGQIEEALVAGDSDQLQTVAHGFKGSAASIGALGFSAVARELEVMAMGEDLSTAPAIVARLRESLTQLAASCALIDWDMAVTLES